MKTRTNEPRKRPRRDDVRAAIEQAALEEFFTSGYAATTLEAIARRAGYTKGAVYSNYGSKQELFATLAQERIGTLLTHRVAAILDNTTASSDVATVADELGRLSSENQNWNILVVELAVQAARDPEAAQIYRELMGSLVAGIATALRAYLARVNATNLEQVDVDMIARFIISTSNITALNGTLDPTKYRPAQRQAIFRIVLEGAHFDGAWATPGSPADDPPPQVPGRDR